MGEVHTTLQKDTYFLSFMKFSKPNFSLAWSQSFPFYFFGTFDFALIIFNLELISSIVPILFNIHTIYLTVKRTV